MNNVTAAFPVTVTVALALGKLTCEAEACTPIVEAVEEDTLITATPLAALTLIDFVVPCLTVSIVLPAAFVTVTSPN